MIVQNQNSVNLTLSNSSNQIQFLTPTEKLCFTTAIITPAKKLQQESNLFEEGRTTPRQSVLPKLGKIQKNTEKGKIYHSNT